MRDELIRRRKSLFDIVTDIEREIDREIEWMLTKLKESEASSMCLEPLHDVQEFPDEFKVTVDLPGVSKDDVKLNVYENEIHIYAPCSYEYELRKRCRIRASCYKLDLELPSEIIIDEVKARFREGVLEIRLPKKEKGIRIRID